MKKSAFISILISVMMMGFVCNTACTSVDTTPDTDQPTTPGGNGGAEDKDNPETPQNPEKPDTPENPDNPETDSKTLVAYFSAQGHTQAIAERIAELTGADIYRIEAAQPYASNPYDDSDRIQREAYNDMRPAVGNPPAKETIAAIDTLFVGSPTWWHQPAMVVCTFLEAYDLKGKVVIPFFTYGATTYLNESIHKIYRCTPDSKHIPEILPEDLDPDDITVPGRPDDSGIDMPGSSAGTESWLRRIGVID